LGRVARIWLSVWISNGSVLVESSSPREHVVDLKVHFAPRKRVLRAHVNSQEQPFDIQVVMKQDSVIHGLTPQSISYSRSSNVCPASVARYPLRPYDDVPFECPDSSNIYNRPSNTYPATGAHYPLKPYDDVPPAYPNSSYQPPEYPS